MIFEMANTIILIIIILTSILAVKFKDLLASVIALGLVSLLLSLEFYILQAPDVAIAEAGVGAALTTAIYVFAVRGTQRLEEEE
ncbi:MAG: DUF4040 domain-containing protein [Candidatus Diapherotrites archaeon]|nr:DUF4040 domain-containing protein [Candidatus Diapherotrites archaeon]